MELTFGANRQHQRGYDVLIQQANLNYEIGGLSEAGGVSVNLSQQTEMKNEHQQIKQNMRIFNSVLYLAALIAFGGCAASPFNHCGERAGKSLIWRHPHRCQSWAGAAVFYIMVTEVNDQAKLDPSRLAAAPSVCTADGKAREARGASRNGSFYQDPASVSAAGQV